MPFLVTVATAVKFSGSVKSWEKNNSNWCNSRSSDSIWHGNNEVIFDLWQEKKNILDAWLTKNKWDDDCAWMSL